MKEILRTVNDLESTPSGTAVTDKSASQNRFPEIRIVFRGIPRVPASHSIRADIERSLAAEWTGTGCGVVNGKLALPGRTDIYYCVGEYIAVNGHEVDIQIYAKVAKRYMPEAFCVNLGAIAWRFKYVRGNDTLLVAQATLRRRHSTARGNLNIGRSDIVTVLEHAIGRFMRDSTRK
ncbi:MAG: hypothetical protein ABSC23_04605 [Bryobacteraceae bacterium]|jgi:hypothetical protein